MDIELLAIRQSIAEWRDRQFFTILGLINQTAIASKVGLEAQIVDAALVQSALDPAGFAGHRIDLLMRTGVGEWLAQTLADASAELRALSSTFEGLAAKLETGTSSLEMPALPAPPASEVPETLGSDAAAPSTKPVEEKPAAGKLSRFGSLVSGSAKEWHAKARVGVSDLATTVSRTLQDRSGLDERLRRAAGQRIALAWMGDTGEPVPFKGQLFNLINTIALEARSMSL